MSIPCGGAGSGDFQRLRPLLLERLERFEIRGGAVSAFVDGRCVARYWAGEARPGVGWTADTIGDVASATKILTTTATLLLVDGGELELERPVRHYWPSFADGGTDSGKDRVLVRHLLTHQAGLVGIRAPRLPPDVLLAWEEMIGWLERETPWWPPGQAHGYHAFTFGYLLGELVRRVSGARRFREFVADRISRPLGIDFFIGVPDGHAGPIADAVRDPYDPVLFPDDDSPSMRMNNPPDPGMGFRNSPEWRAADIPAVNGHGSADGLARLAALFASGGELAGTRLLRPATVRAALSVQVSGRDWFGYEASWGLGFSVDPERNLAGGLGGGGSQLWVDPESRLGFGYVQNTGHPTDDPGRVGSELLDACRAVLQG